MNAEERLADLRAKVARLHDWLQDRDTGGRADAVLTVKSVLFVMREGSHWLPVRGWPSAELPQGQT